MDSPQGERWIWQSLGLDLVLALSGKIPNFFAWVSMAAVLQGKGLPDNLVPAVAVVTGQGAGSAVQHFLYGLAYLDQVCLSRHQKLQGVEFLQFRTVEGPDRGVAAVGRAGGA